jgi:hypothetical protein
LKGLKSMFSGLSRKKTDATLERPMAVVSSADASVVAAQKRASKIVTKRFYGLSIENHLTCKFRGYSIPLIAATLMEFVLTMDGPKTQGIFRLSAPAGEMAAARNQIEVRHALFVVLDAHFFLAFRIRHCNFRLKVSRVMWQFRRRVMPWVIV